MEALPPTVKLLIKELDKLYAFRTPKATDDLITIQRRAAQRELVDTLLVLLEEEERTTYV